MKLYDQRISKNISVSSAAFYANLMYIIIVMIFALIQQFVNPTGEAYDTVVGIVEFIVVTLYWIIINVVYFTRPGRTKSGTTITYLVFTFLPICVFTIATEIIIYYFPTSEFQLSWNILTWIVAPTLFWYLPFSYAYYSLGFYINIMAFMGVCLVYVLFLQAIGILFGLAWSSRNQERQAAINRQRERSRQRRRRPVTLEEGGTAAKEEPILTENVLDNKMYTGTNPFIGNHTEEQPVDTRSLERMTGQRLGDETQNNLSETADTNKADKLTREEKRELRKKKREEKRQQRLERKEKRKKQKSNDS